MVKTLSNPRVVLACFIISFILGIISRMNILNMGEAKILFYKTLEPSYKVEQIFKN